MSDTPARGAGVSEKSLPEPYEVWRPNRIRWSKSPEAFACLPGGDLGGDTIIATDDDICATQLSVADAWAITAAISPRPTVRVAAVNEDGSTLNSYPPQHITPVTAAAPERPWAIYLTDREHAYRLLCFDLDGKTPEAAEAAEQDTAALARLLIDAGLAPVVCQSGPQGGRHIWIALREGVAAEGDQQIGDRGCAVLPAVGEQHLHFPCAILHCGSQMLHRHEGEGRQLERRSSSIACARGVSDLQPGDGGETHEPPLNASVPAVLICDLPELHPDVGRFIDQPGVYRHAASMTDGSARSANAAADRCQSSAVMAESSLGAAWPSSVRRRYSFRDKPSAKAEASIRLTAMSLSPRTSTFGMTVPPLLMISRYHYPGPSAVENQKLREKSRTCITQGTAVDPSPIGAAPTRVYRQPIGPV